MFFDTHAHYDDARFDEDRHEVLTQARRSGVDFILNASSGMESSMQSLMLTKDYDFVFAAVGVHPHEVEKLQEGDMEILAEYAAHEKVVAIGEIGLDYYYDNSPRELQRKWFRRQIELALSLSLPIIVHDRDAHEDSMEIVKKTGASGVGGVFHCYSGSVEMAKELLKQNFYISFAGPVTFKNARKAVEVVEAVPMERLLIETDCPYLSPEPYRGQRNDSSRVGIVAQRIAQIKGLTVEEVARITLENARQLFRIK